MNLKDFFKPTLGKVIIFLILMVGLNYWIISSTFVSDARILIGLPLGFFPIGSSMIFFDNITPPTVTFSWINLILDIIFWYLISCLIIGLYKKIIHKH